jgi:hypothetical protein
MQYGVCKHCVNVIVFSMNWVRQTRLGNAVCTVNEHTVNKYCVIWWFQLHADFHLLYLSDSRPAILLFENFSHPDANMSFFCSFVSFLF